MAADPLYRIAEICHDQPHDALTQIAEVLGLEKVEAENAKLRAAFADLLSVRDQFALGAMKAMLAAGHDKPMRGYENWREEFCAEAFRWADAMMRARTAGVMEDGRGR